LQKAARGDDDRRAQNRDMIASPMPPAPHLAADEPTLPRARVAELVRRYGWNTTSFQVLEPGYRYFLPDDDACVAYVDTGRAWVAAGAPLAGDDRLEAVTTAFVNAARAAGRRACFFATEQKFAARAPLTSLLVGEQPVWDPRQWEATLRQARSLREQVRRARAKGVEVRALEASPPAAADAPALDGAAAADVVALIRRWSRTRELAPMSFLARVEPLALLPEQRLFLAEREGALVGLLSVTPVWGRGGWLFQNLVRSPEAPNGTSEALVDAAMRVAADEGRTFVTLGLAPLAGQVPPPLRFARRAGRALYDFEGLRAFKAKLRPGRWDPVYLSFPADSGPVRAVVDVLAAFARGGLWRFGLRTLARGPALVVRLLTMLLVPWTALLAAASARRWFPHPAVKWAWVVFDLGLLTGLGLLQRRWRHGLARALVVAIGIDAIVTAVEASCWNLPRTTSLGAGSLLAAAVAAPVLAYFVLGRATARRAG
jgi:phosphatidylglycerol lysyltransferase